MNDETLSFACGKPVEIVWFNYFSMLTKFWPKLVCNAVLTAGGTKFVMVVESADLTKEPIESAFWTKFDVTS